MISNNELRRKCAIELALRYGCSEHNGSNLLEKAKEIETYLKGTSNERKPRKRR